MRGGKLISGNYFSAQEHASSKNRHILIFQSYGGATSHKAMNVFVEKYILILELLAFSEVKVFGESAYLNF